MSKINRVPVTYGDGTVSYIEFEEKEYISPKEEAARKRQEEKLRVIKEREESKKRILQEKAKLKAKYSGHNKGYSVNGKKLGRPSKGVSNQVNTDKIIKSDNKMKTVKKSKKVKRRLKRSIKDKIRLVFTAFIMFMTVVGINTSVEWLQSLSIAPTSVKASEKIEDVMETFGIDLTQEPEEEEKVEPVNMACSTSSAKTYMDYKTITNKSSKQYKYIREHMTVGNDGYLRDKDGNIGVALGSHFGEIGTKYQVTLDTGITFNVVKIEVKSDKHTNNGCEQKWDKSVIEFVVDSSKMEKAKNGYVYSGNFNNNSNFKGNIVSMYEID